MKKQFFIISYSLFFVIALFFVDQILEISYFYKVLTKAILILISFAISKYYFSMSFDYLKPKNVRQYKTGIYLSIISFLGIFITFFILKDWIDMNSIKNDFINKYQLNGIKFFIASFYLIFINALLEEYFFRGFIFFNIFNKKFAYFFSSFLFSVYHLSNFINWFEQPILLILPLSGLFIVGILFNYLCDLTQDIFHSYIPHLFADLAIVIIGYFIIIH
jgi:membrane protease YdiL (CAAX protease family)